MVDRRSGNTRDVSYREFPVNDALERWAECLWVRVGTGEPDGFARIVPDGCMDLLWSERAGLTAIGPNTTAFVSPLEPGGSVLGVRLHPGAAPPLFGVAAPELLDGRVPARALWGDPADRLEQALHGAPDMRERARLLVGFVSDRARRVSVPDPLVRAAVDRLERVNVAEVARDLAVSERHLRRLVTAEVGYGPKRLGRVLRLRRALARVRAGVELAEVAFEAGYADQAHFTNECRALAGVSPSVFSKTAGAAAATIGP
jgi:AraC-like DNA-binding protein